MRLDSSLPTHLFSEALRFSQIVNITSFKLLYTNVWVQLFITMFWASYEKYVHVASFVI